MVNSLSSCSYGADQKEEACKISPLLMVCCLCYFGEVVPKQSGPLPQQAVLVLIEQVAFAFGTYHADGGELLDVRFHASNDASALYRSSLFICFPQCRSQPAPSP